MDLTKFAALSFDCYGTLIDWETGILGVLRKDRPGWCATPEPSEEYSYGAEFASMGEFAAAVETAFRVGPVS